MKTTFELPDALLRQAKAVAASEGRPLRDLVSESLQRAVTEAERAARGTPEGNGDWAAFLSKLEKRPDGTYFNPGGIQDERFFTVLEGLRSERLNPPFRNPFGDVDPVSPAEPIPKPPAEKRKRSPDH